MPKNIHNKSIWPVELHQISSADTDAIANQLYEGYKHLLENENIPTSESNVSILEKLYIPLGSWLATKGSKPYILGINGAQGAGKTTFTKILSFVLTEYFKKSVVTLSLDDFYLRKSSRAKLGNSIHPLLSTRGVPGTHDINMVIHVVTSLKNNLLPITIPKFNKANDDIEDRDSWKTINKKPDIVLFEGWCIGAIADNNNELASPINSLEKNDDPDLTWRSYVNMQLNNQYQEFFSLIDDLVMLKVPSFNKIIEWRNLQEIKLQLSEAPKNKSCMNKQQVHKFVMHFERVTRKMLNEMPNRAMLTFEINDQHQIENGIYNKP